MNIVYYLTQFPKLSESFILNELYELDRRGHNVAVFAANNPEPNIEHEEYSELDIPVEYVDIPGMSDAFEFLSPKALHPCVLKCGLF